METFAFKLVSPDKTLIEDDVTMVVLPGIEGDIGVLKHHSPIITTLRPGTVRVYKQDNLESRTFVNGGVAKITPDRCTALITEGLSLEVMDRSQLEIEIQNLVEDLNDAKSPAEKEETTKSLDIARNKLFELNFHG